MAQAIVPPGPRWCPARGRRSGRSRPAPRPDRTPRTSGRARRRSRTPPGSCGRLGQRRCARSRSCTTRSCPRDLARRGQVLRGQLRRPVERGGLEVLSGQRADGVEGEQVGQRAQLAVLSGGRAERPGPQVTRRGQHRVRVCRGDLRRGPDGDGLEPLGAEHRAEAAAPGVPPVVGDRGVPDAALAGRPIAATRQPRPSCSPGRAGAAASRPAPRSARPAPRRPRCARPFCR